ncbi:MAG: hypothetical protein AAF443_02250 [Chlamydiota bacterium]
MKKNIEDFIPSEGKDPNAHPKLRTWEKTIVWIACLSLVIIPFLFGWLGFVLSLVASGIIMHPENQTDCFRRIRRLI